MESKDKKYRKGGSMKETKCVIVSVIIILGLFILTSCSNNNVITSAAVLNTEQGQQKSVMQQPIPAVQEKQKEIIQGGQARVISADTQYYYIRLSDTAVDPQTIVGYVGKRVLVEIANTGSQDARIVSEDLKLDIIVRPGSSYEFEFTPDTEKVFYVGDISHQRKIRVVTLEDMAK